MGGAAKVRIFHDIEHAMADGCARAALDVGCIGLRPLEFWEPLWWVVTRYSGAGARGAP